MTRVRSSATVRIATLADSLENLEIRTTENTRAIQSTAANVNQRLNHVDNTIRDFSALEERVRKVADIPANVASLRAVAVQHANRLTVIDEKLKNAQDYHQKVVDLNIGMRAVNAEVGSLTGRASILEDRVSELGGRSVWSMLRTR